MKKEQCLMITLPKELAELPIQIVRGTDHEKLIFCIQPTSDNDTSYADNLEKKYVLIWRQNDYLKVDLDEIIWIEANGSYSMVHLTQKRTMTISFHLAIVERDLPKVNFMRIHRSCIVNLKYVESLIGNSLRIEGALLTIGRMYRGNLLERFMFLGVRRNNK